MILMAPIHLEAESHHELLTITVRRFNEAASWLAQKGFDSHTFGKFSLQRGYYRQVRTRFGLSAQMAVRAIAVVAAAFKRDRNRCPAFRSNAAVPYDARILSFKRGDNVSILTLRGRRAIRFRCGERQRQLMQRGVGECRLIQRRGKWCLMCSVEVEEPVASPPRQFLGVDLGIINLAATSDGEIIKACKVDRLRRIYGEKRRRLQKAEASKRDKRPKNIRRKLRRLSRKERFFCRDVNHCISKDLVRKAKDSIRGIALEDLRGIRGRIRFRKADRARMSSWSFGQLRRFIEYKAVLAGVLVMPVLARNSSRQCSKCRWVDKQNRRFQKFSCVRCAHTDHADVNAAKNHAYRAEVSLPIVSMLVLLRWYSGTSTGTNAGVADRSLRFGCE
ncbi:MAG TPA: transposase [Candidatus Baltobacteraceae bacterium]|nr:transposase [Candidatus Baltobacteraceae bacterium]